ncbi:pelota family protein [Caldisphaera sp.]|uniref:pelota family protein n=1 Tax=Caldisphaera sp. TaxID=2060322 RepID=UPI00397E2C82
MKLEIGQGKNQIIVTPESEEDLWNLMLILRKGDYIYTRVLRDVSTKNSKSKERKPIDIKLRIENTEFQPLTGKLRIFGVIEEGPERFGVKGRHQSAYISLGQQIILEREEEWDEKTINKLKSSGPKGRGLIVAIDYDEYAISLITSLGVYNIESNSIYISGKDDPNRENEIDSLINDLANRIINYLSKEKANVLIIAGPGKLKDELSEKIKSMTNIKIIIDNVSNGGIAGINEVLRRKSIIDVLKEFSSIKSQEILDEFMMYASEDRDMIAYTLNEVYNAAKLGAIDKVVILDKLIYSIDDNERLIAEKIIEYAEKTRAEVIIVTEDSIVYPMLSNFGGVIAILRYKIPKDSLKNYSN